MFEWNTDFSGEWQKLNCEYWVDRYKNLTCQHTWQLTGTDNPYPVCRKCGKIMGIER